VSSVRRLLTSGRGTRKPTRPRIHFLHIGKTGGTAIRNGLEGYAESPSYKLLFPGHAVRLCDIPRGEKVVFVLRDPLTRFVSAFNGRLREDRPRYHYPWSDGERVAFKRFKSPDDLATALSATDEQERAAAIDAMGSIGHINTPYSFWFGTDRSFRRRLGDVFFIAFQDRLTDDFEALKAKIGLPLEASLPSDEIAAHRTPTGFSRALSETGRGNLERWYEPDLQFVALCRELAPTVNASPTA